MLSKIMGAVYLYNVLALAAGMITRDAQWIEYFNLLGAVAFGAWLVAPELI